MQVKFKEINALPARTWRWMGVNGGEADLTLPAIQQYKGNPFSGTAPEGVEIGDGIDLAVGEPFPTLNPEVLQFVRKHRNSGFTVHAAPGVQVAGPIVFDYRVDAANPAVVDDNCIVAGEGAELTVVMHYAGGGDAGFHCGFTRLIAKRNAVLRLIQVQTLSDGCEHFDNVGALALEGARIEIVQAELGGGRSFTDCVSRLEGERSGIEVSALYLGDGERRIDLNVLAEHRGRRTQSVIGARGALIGRSEKTFRGTIDFKKGSAGSSGREEENAMLLGPGVRSRSAPLILCSEEDVEGHHAASAGRMDANRMFYLMSRGLSELEAKKLILEAAFEPVTAMIPVPAYRQEISDFLRERLSRIE